MEENTNTKKSGIKPVSVVTLIFHILFLVDAAITVKKHPDIFFISAIGLILVYFVFLTIAYRGKYISKRIIILYCVCTAIQCILAYFLFVRDILIKNFGLGSGLAMIFYIFALTGSCILVLLINILKFTAKGKKKGNTDVEDSAGREA